MELGSVPNEKTAVIIGGTPTVLQSETRHRLTVTDADGSTINFNPLAITVGRPGDFNRDSRVNADDALLMYYALAPEFEPVFGNPGPRATFLGPYIDPPDDPAYQAALRRIVAFAAHDDAGTSALNVNGDTALNHFDASIIFHVLFLPELLGPDADVPPTGIPVWWSVFLQPYAVDKTRTGLQAVRDRVYLAVE